MCLGRRGERREEVDGGRRCLRVGVTDVFDHVCELPASNGGSSRDLDEREPPPAMEAHKSHRRELRLNQPAHASTGGDEESDCRGGKKKKKKSLQDTLSAMYIFGCLKVWYFCCLWQHKGGIFSIFIVCINRLAALKMEAVDASF